MDKKIRSKVVRESLLDYETLANSLKENTRDAIKSILDETVRQEYAKLLTEGEDDYEEEEVEDTDDDANVETTAVTDADSQVEGGEGESEEGMEPANDDETEDDVDVEETPTEDGTEVDVASEGEDEEGDEWAEFDKYKVSDGEYDFSNAEDEDIVKVYKLMKDDDQILVNKTDNGMVSVQDNTTGAEYLIDMNGDSSSEVEEDGFGMEDDFDYNEENEDMNESTEKMFELVLESDSNLGYTDNYQKKDVMTNPGMSEPSKGTNDWDKGVPHGTEKPWSGKNGGKKENQPFDGEKGKQVEEEYEVEMEEPIDESNLSQSRWNDTHAAHNRVPAANKDEYRRDGIQKTSKGARYRASGNDNDINVDVNIKAESTIRRINKALKENKELKESLTNVMASLKEAAVTNHNLAQIIKLVSENATTKEEKDEIVKRFMKEAKTVEASKNLYESLSNELKKKNTMSINEEKSFNVEGSKKVNETQIYKSKDLMESLDLMHRLMK